MGRTNLRWVVGFASILCLVGGLPGVRAVSAAPPTGSPSPPTDRPAGNGRQSKIEEIQSIGVDRQLTTFSGVVLDVNDHPLGNVQVKLFVDGQLTGTSLTESNGYYDLRVPFDPSADVTALLWYLAPDHSLMPKALVIQESKASVAAGLISKCVPRASLTPGRQFRVYLFDPATRNKELAESDCLP